VAVARRNPLSRPESSLLGRRQASDPSGDLRSMFVFKGDAQAGGVAHDITLTPVTTAKATSPPSPVMVEVR